MDQTPDNVSHFAEPTLAAIETWLRDQLSAQLGLQPTALDRHERFSRFGLDSVLAAGLITKLSQFLKRPLSATLVWDYPTIDALVRFLSGEDDQIKAPPAVTGGAVEPIAIVGLACRFPGAPTAAAYWQVLTQGVDAVSEVPSQRWDIDRFYSKSLNAAGKMNTRWGGFLDQVDQFDAGFFGISPREAMAMDPQQRLLLELSWEALEDAGIAPNKLKGSAAGVYCGAMWHDYARLASPRPEMISQHTATGQDLSIISARVSYMLGCKGRA